MKKVICPDCHEPVEIKEENPKVGEIIECENCGAEIEITSLEPLSVSLIEEEK